ncbi:MAG: gamma-glutamylcyclotransferase family protein [Pseudomonadota bacterium]
MSKNSHSAETRLATYGTLAPGRINHDQLADLNGTWVQATVRGNLIDAGWGAAHGCPGLVLDPAGQTIEVHVFESHDLPDFWEHMDRFEGPGYRRVTVTVQAGGAHFDASIYVLNQ